jgi:hypothetical protein
MAEQRTPTAVSVPLPLPIRFALLPSRIPGQTLSPLLYTLIVSDSEPHRPN